MFLLIFSGQMSILRMCQMNYKEFKDIIPFHILLDNISEEFWMYIYGII